MLIEDGKIQSIINSNENIKEQESSHTVIDGSGKFLIPGLWDAHVHLTFIPEIDHETYFNLFLKNGITSIRDTGALIEKLQPSLNYIKENPILGIWPSNSTHSVWYFWFFLIFV